MSAAIYLLTSSFLHATWNTLLKRERHKNLILFQAIICATLLAWLLVFLFDEVEYGEALNLTLLSGIVEGLYFVTLTRALNTASLAVAYSVMRALSMLLSWILSYLLLGEIPTFWNAMGVAFILVGLTIPLFNRSHLPQKLFWSYLCALTITGYNMIYNRALHLGAKPLVLFATSLAITLPFLYCSMSLEERRSMRTLQFNLPDLRSSFLLGAIILASFSTFLYGLMDTMPALALTIRNASIAFALIFSFLLGERLTRKEVWVLVFIMTGVLIISTVTMYR